MSTTRPQELDLDLARLRADKIAELRILMRDLEDLDAVERVLNGQTHHIAVTAQLLVEKNGGGNGHGHRHHVQPRLLAPAVPAFETEPPPRKKSKKRRKKSLDVTTEVVKEQVLTVLRRMPSPVQAGQILEAIAAKYPPPYAAQSTFNRAIARLRQDKTVTVNKRGLRYPVYSLRVESLHEQLEAVREQKKQERQERRSRGTRARAKQHRGSGIVPKPDPAGVSMSVLRVLADHPDGLQISQIVEILEADGSTKFLADHAHNSQVSWALKGHRDRHRIKTITQRDGTRLHKALRPAFSVTKG